MDLFKLFQEKKKFRLILFLLLGLITVSINECTINYGFPIGYAEGNGPKGSLPFNFDFISLSIDIIIMFIIFFAVERIRKNIEAGKNSKIFDISLFSVIVYLIIGFILNIVELNFIDTTISTFTWFIPIFLLKSFIDKIYKNPNTTIDYTLHDYRLPTTFNYRLSLLIVSLLLFFILYYSLKFYYKRKYPAKKSKDIA